jgi:hypothetical protein
MIKGEKILDKRTNEKVVLLDIDNDGCALVRKNDDMGSWDIIEPNDWCDENGDRWIKIDGVWFRVKKEA